MAGTSFPPARRNYGNRVTGPWVFGMVWQHGGLSETRLFIVERRDRRTLLPIIRRHIRPGTTIQSDEWAAYADLGRLGFIHESVVHSQNFVDPITGAHTQRIEAQWGAMKQRILKRGRGTRMYLLKNHLAEAWWRTLHPRTPFWDILAELRQRYPQ